MYGNDKNGQNEGKISPAFHSGMQQRVGGSAFGIRIWEQQQWFQLLGVLRNKSQNVSTQSV